MITRPSRRGSRRWLTAALSAACLLIAPVPAMACGNPLLWAMLFKKVPEAKLVYDAELSARAGGHVTARDYTARPGQPYHSWSKAWLMDLAAEMQPAFQGKLAPGETVTILLADEVAALRFAGGEDPRFIPAGALKDIGHYDLVTTINALKAVWRDGLSFDDMLALDLAWSEAGVEPFARVLANHGPG